MKTKNEPSLFMRLQEDEDFASAACGCILQRSPEEGLEGVPEYLRCKKCETALNCHDELLEALRERYHALHIGDRELIKKLGSLIAKAEGKQ